MSRRRGGLEVSALYAPAMSLATAINRLPSDKLAFNKVRYRWVEIVRGHPMLTAAQRTVGLAIAQQHINHNPESPWFHSAWAAHQTIATETGLTRRTVVSAMVALRQIGLIAIGHGAGRKVPGGRTDRYTLRTDWLDVLERATHIVRQKDVKNFHRSSYQTGSQVHQSGEKNAESGEIGDQMIGNSQNEDVKEFRTTLPNTTPLESSFTTPIGPLSEAPQLAVTPHASNGKKEKADRVTAQDHLHLAILLGAGDVERGYVRLGCLDESDTNDLALRYRLDPSSAGAVRAEVVRLEQNTGRPG
jgi:hypothetical protein